MSADRRRLLIATGSRHKFGELRDLLDLPNTELLSLADLGLGDSATEDGSTFEENARKKALHYAQLSGLPTLADDSGIEVDALGGRPGVHTRRYAGSDATDERNNRKLLDELAGFYGPDERTARYRCVLVLVEDGVVVETTHGVFEGRIAFEPRGTGGFGYDPIFEPASEPVGGRTVGLLSLAEKNAISHRARAALGMRELLVARGY
ncbi:MAG TPA: RdgB/HAM1 family non-canonical purine NTP pyrophosphatase [Candidatus Limnocylindrales bacterium]|nr:RdgB/HAM1 family non-canonical purine NTP pyrophosphatase [Candidatus Limnocylindrales bacterium]